MMRPLLFAAALVAAATACDVCSGLSVHEEPATDILLPATGDLASCACGFVFAYSAGPTPGRVTLTATPGVGTIVVYGDAEGTELIAELPESSTVDGIVVHSRTGTIRVDVATVASPPASASVAVSSTAINTAPVLEMREDIEFGIFARVLVPWSAEGILFPLTLRDDDNNEQGLRAVLVLDPPSESDVPTTAFSVPAVSGVVFEEGAADSLLRRVVVSGPGSAVEAAINNARIVPTRVADLSSDEMIIRVQDAGLFGEDPLETVLEVDFGVYPAGVVDVPRGATDFLNSGFFPPETGTEAVFLVHGAHRIEFTELSLTVRGRECATEYLRVWDGTDVATARLLSTDLVPTGEICSFSSQFLPSYDGSTGEFVVEYFVIDNVASVFATTVSPTPLGFRAWLDGDPLFEIAGGGEPLLLPPIMVTSLPEPTDIAVNITATGGALSLRFADSFVDIVRPSDDAAISLALTEADGVPAMLRMGDALREVQIAATDPGTVVVRVEAWSGGIAAEVLEVVVEVGSVAVNAPAVLATHAFRPVPLAVTVDASGPVTAEVSVEGGLGLVSMDPRARLWVDIGYGRNVTATGTAGEVNAALAGLVYKATEGGGVETIVVRAGGVERTISIDVDPDCDGTHFVYGRQLTITERAGPAPDRHGPELFCRWFITGPREMRFPFWEIPVGRIFNVEDSDSLLFNYLFRDPGTLRASPLPFFQVLFNALDLSTPGFVATFQPTATINDPPVILTPEGLVRVVRKSTTRLAGLYIDDFEDGTVIAWLETDAGSLQEEGTRRIEIEAATFDELDAWATGIDFLAGNVQTTATLTLSATDAGGSESVAEFQIEVLPCSGVSEVVLGDGSATVAVGDGSETSDYVDGLTCGWRLTGAPGPAVLEVAFLNLDCGGDTVAVYDGSSATGRFLGSFCQADEVEAAVGTLVSSTGSFFVSLVSNSDGLVDDGFAFVYGPVGAGVATDLGAAPRTADPERTDATVIALDGSRVAVFGGHTGVRAVASTLVFSVGGGWRLLAGGDGPSGRSRAAGAAVSGSQIVVHGGVDVDGAVVAETWVGNMDDDEATIVWVQPTESGPATAAAAMVVHDGAAYLVDASGVWVLDEAGTWTITGATPGAVVATSSAYRAADGTVCATSTDGSLWTLSLTTRAWTELATELGVECAAWACSGAMLGPDEYVVGGVRVNMTSLAVAMLPAASAGQAVGGQYLGQPSLFVYESGSISAVALTLGVSSHGPLVSPSSGGTEVAMAGEQLSTCGDPVCEFGSAGQTAAGVVTERSATCTTPAGSPGMVTVALVCESGRRYTSPAPLAFFAEPSIAGVDPAAPDPGDAVAVSLDGVADETLALVDTPLCRFDGEQVAATVSGRVVDCRVPETAAAGATVTLEISLDGQQFGSATALPLSASSSSSSPSSSLSSPLLIAIGIIVVTVSVIFLVVVLRYRRLANARVDTGPAPWEILIESIELFEVIGAGAYGSVHRGRFRGGEVAVKVTRAGTVTSEMIEAFRKESALMAELRHPNIVLFMGACTAPPDIAIVLEFMPNGSLFNLLRDSALVLRKADHLSFALDIIKGMAYLHAADPPIIHRDLKSLNVLVDKSWTLKVSDFGLTEIFVGEGTDDDFATRDRKKAGQQPGSVHWMAPEVLRGHQATKASDMFSFGVTLWEICSQERPYYGIPVATVVSGVIKNDDFRPRSRRTIEPSLSEMIERCWASDARVRPSFPELRELLTAMQEEITETSTISEIGRSESTSVAGEACVVALTVERASELWDRDPAHMRQMMTLFRDTAGSMAQTHNGFARPAEGESMVCVFATAISGFNFAGALQVELNAAPWPGESAMEEGAFRGLRIACAIIKGPVHRSTDVLTRRVHIEGVSVTQALEMAANEARGGQIVAPHRLCQTVDVVSTGLVAFQRASGGIVELYPAALKERHNMFELDQSIDQSGSESKAGAKWLIKSSEVEIGPLIGAGSFGAVFKATWRGTPVAAKQLHAKVVDGNDELDFLMEGGVASKLRHPNVCLVLGVSKAEAGKVYVVSEYMSKGSVFDAIVTAHKEIAGKIKFKVARGIARGLRYLHEQEPAVVHRSLTARNVLLGDGWTAKISDFGLARVKDSGATMTKIGTTAYSAPEVVQGERYDEKADVYAFGVVVWEIVAQEVAWGSERMGTVIEAVMAGKRPAVDSEWRKEDEVGVLVEVLERCWTGNVEVRPGMDEVGRVLEGG